MPYNNDDQLFTKRYVTEVDGNKFKRPVQDDPFQTTEQAMRTVYGGQDQYSIPIGNRLSITPELSYDMIKQSQGLTDIDINARSFGAGVNTPWGTFRGGKNLVNVDVESPERQEEFKGKGYSLGYSKFNEKGYGVTLDVVINEKI